jgi:hypothetical protein
MIRRKDPRRPGASRQDVGEVRGDDPAYGGLLRTLSVGDSNQGVGRHGGPVPTTAYLFGKRSGAARRGHRASDFPILWIGERKSLAGGRRPRLERRVRSRFDGPKGTPNRKALE